MMTLEENSKKRARKNQLKHIILGTAAIAGGLALALVAPNVLGALGKLGVLPKRRDDEYINAARRRLKRQGLLVEKDGFLRLSEKGERALIKLSLMSPQHAPKKKWDGKWRVLIFDVPERRKNIRRSIRTMLRSAGFERIQDSVWLYPYPCEEYVALLKADLHIGKDLLYLIVDSLEGDRHFRTIFKLPPPPHDPVPPLKLPEILDALLEPILPRPNSPIR